MKRGKEYAEELFDKEIRVTDTTEMVMNNEIYYALLQGGIAPGMLDGRKWVLDWREPTHLYRYGERELALFCRHHELSDDVGYRFSNKTWGGYPLGADTYAQQLRSTWGDFVFIGWDFETFGEHHNVDTGIFDFMRALPAQLKGAGCVASPLARPWMTFGKALLARPAATRVRHHLGRVGRHGVLPGKRLAAGDLPTDALGAQQGPADRQRHASRPSLWLLQSDNLHLIQWAGRSGSEAEVSHTSRPMSGGIWARIGSSPSSSACTRTSSGPWMSTSESTLQPVHVAFVWHMHQPYYRSARTGAFQMPWARLHALKDYLDMVEILADYPTIHQTFNLVPSLVEQLEDYAAAGQTGSAPDGTTGTGSAADVYWEHTEKPAADLSPAERAFVVERMCEPSDHPRANLIPATWNSPSNASRRPARDGTSVASVQCGRTARPSDLVHPAWFDPTLLETEPLLSLVQRGRDFREEDKSPRSGSSDILAGSFPHREAAERGQIELSTSPYFHPILPLLVNSDSARVGAGDTILPRRRFAHAEDAWEQVARAMAKHQQVFGSRPRGMWCSEQAVGEDVLTLLLRAGIHWTIADQTVLTRSVAEAQRGRLVPARSTKGGLRGPWHGRFHGGRPGLPLALPPYLMRREDGEIAIVFRDHTLSDLIGFAYQSWDSRDAANDLVRRIRAIGASFAAGRATSTAGEGPSGAVPRPAGGIPLHRPSCRSSPSPSMARTPGSTTRTMARTSCATCTMV